MSILYDSNQRMIRNLTGAILPRGFIDKYIPFKATEVPEFRPTWLVRVSDMQVVPGSTVNDPYCALSYSRNQCGGIANVGDSEKIDAAKHTIVSKREHKRQQTRCTKGMLNQNGGIFAKFKVWGTTGRTSDQDDYDTTGSENPCPCAKESVDFKTLIQGICNYFCIEYIWFDQMCIDQYDHDAKMREIRQMHRVYANARCALALVPELGSTAERDDSGQFLANIDVIPDSQWAKRMWTLEEAYMSKKILFVGRDVHFWTNYPSIEDDGPAGTFIASIQHTKKWKACTALWHAKRRTSSTVHDRIFALVNIFPELKDHITFSYHQPELDLAIQFYGRLAEHDISILSFGAPAIDDMITASSGAESSLAGLPSWTGVDGVHIPQRCGEAGYGPDSRAFHCVVTGKCMHLTSSFLRVHITADSSAKTSNFADNSNYILDGLPYLPIENYASITSSSKDLTFVAATGNSRARCTKAMQHYGLKATHFLPVKVENDVISNTLLAPTYTAGFLSLTEECDECVILCGHEFHFTDIHTCRPVLKKEEDDIYKAIGVCILAKALIDDSSAEPKEVFLIQ